MAQNNLNLKTKNKHKKQYLNSGIPCKIHSCTKCCFETRMPLTNADIKRIAKQGYRYKDFIIKRKSDRYLKNQKGKCVFLRDDGCKIYSFRPDGCRLYPLVYNETVDQAILHDFCPYEYMFKITREDIDILKNLIKKLK